MFSPAPIAVRFILQCKSKGVPRHRRGASIAQSATRQSIHGKANSTTPAGGGFVPARNAIRDRGVILRQSEAVDAAQAFRLLRAFRSIRDRAARFRILENAEAMAKNQWRHETADEHRCWPSDISLH
ncbi:hypothetical protein J2R76_002499 [Bradyrhizobium sp. USDA 4532]|uniref:hypothetical protein n=1 Tax=unclassified Bradyrhizobium TaxID=2631580 RepID=UPI0020A01508|nr:MULTISPECIES: hypothetical protein [unclassified Bradyrhizobium]MCP1834162.1 hypothetical protein [Bradyrhizobium sp. USDA 4545]MCP1918908.1 hypothetical protein [Bradyrhizobium sp. USDA 4532]